MLINQKSPSKILVIKHGALGDMVQGFGAFASLRNGNPKTHISLLTTPPFTELANMMPWFDEVLVDNRSSFLNIVETLRIRKLLRDDWKFIVDLQCSRRTKYYFQYFTRADVSWIGVAKGCSDPLPNLNGINNHQRMLIASEMAGGKRTPIDMFWLLSGCRKEGKQKFLKPYAVLVPGSSNAKPQKRWPSKNFSDLANKLQSQGIQVIIVGTAADSHVTREVQSMAPTSINLCGETSIAELAQLSFSANYVIGNDTGPVFLAAATGAPTLMIMGADTDPLMSAPVGERCSYIQGKSINAVSVDRVLERLKVLKGNW